MLAVSAPSGCSSDTESDSAETGHPAEEGLDKAANRSVCTAEAEPIDPPYGEGFPADWPFPPDTVVYDYEDRGSSGVIVTATSSAPFETVLDFMNDDVVSAGFEIEEGETEENDAEAEWRSSDFRGRWAIRRSSTCDGETVIQVLAGEI